MPIFDANIIQKLYQENQHTIMVHLHANGPASILDPHLV